VKVEMSIFELNKGTDRKDTKQSQQYESVERDGFWLKYSCAGRKCLQKDWKL
jgi:hypothetical protein